MPKPKKKVYNLNLNLTAVPAPEICEMEDWTMTIVVDEDVSLTPYEISKIAIQAAQEALNSKNEGVLAFGLTH